MEKKELTKLNYLVCKHCGGMNIEIRSNGTTNYRYCNSCEQATDLIAEKVKDTPEEKITSKQFSSRLGQILYETDKYLEVKELVMDYIEQQLDKAREEGRIEAYGRLLNFVKNLIKAGIDEPMPFDMWTEALENEIKLVRGEIEKGSLTNELISNFKEDK